VSSMSRTSFGLVLILAVGWAFTAEGRNVSVSGGARTSVNRSANVNRNVNRDVNRSVERNVSRDIDRDVDVDVHGGWGGCCFHPVAAAAAVTTAAVATAAVVGSVVNTLPPACSAVVVNGFTYQQCGSTWYQPQFVGGSTSYTVVNPP